MIVCMKERGREGKESSEILIYKKNEKLNKKDFIYINTGAPL